MYKSVRLIGCKNKRRVVACINSNSSDEEIRRANLDAAMNWEMGVISMLDYHLFTYETRKVLEERVERGEYRAI